jgi:hypothetical protein
MRLINLIKKRDKIQGEIDKYEGCWIDSSNGSYIGEEVQKIARYYGKKGRIIKNGSNIYNDAWDEAEEFLNKIAPKGYYFGNNPDTADWGMWNIEEADND